MDLIPVTIRGEYAVVKLTKGHYAKIDLEDWPKLIGRRWCFSGSAKNRGYAKAFRDGKYVWMHQVICPQGKPDHINRNPLDNRRCNLRPSTSSTNTANRQCGWGETGYRGVVQSSRRRWRAVIIKDGKHHRCGSYMSPEDAAIAADIKGVELYGEFYVPNFPYDASRKPPLPAKCEKAYGPTRPTELVDGETKYRCKRCGEWLSATAFPVARNTPCGVGSRCRVCVRLGRREEYREKRGVVRKYRARKGG